METPKVGSGIESFYGKIKPVILEHRTNQPYMFKGRRDLVPRDFDAIAQLPGVDYFAPGNRLQERAHYLSTGSRSRISGVLDDEEFSIALAVAEALKKDPGTTRPRMIKATEPLEFITRMEGLDNYQYGVKVVSPREIAVSRGRRIILIQREDSHIGNEVAKFVALQTVDRDNKAVFQRLLTEYYNAWCG